MSKRYGTFVHLILDCLDLDIPLIPLESPYDWVNRKRANALSRKRYQEALWHMRRQGYFKVVNKKGQKFIKLTAKGQLEKLLLKADIVKQNNWDGKWRVLVFDIPENSRHQRDQFRWLLKRNNFVKLQASVFVSPYSLNREAIAYLNQTGLMDYIRIMRVDEMDNDTDLRKKFGLTHSRP